MEEKKKCAFAGCGYPLRTDNKKGPCGWHIGGRADPRPAGWKAGDAIPASNRVGQGKHPTHAATPAPAKSAPKPAAPRPRTIADVAAKHAAPAAGDDVIAILVARHVFHVEQAAKIEKALEVLRA